MITELDELVIRAANDLSLARSGLDRVLVPVIERTRRAWAMTPEQSQRSAHQGIPFLCRLAIRKKSDVAA